MRKNKKQEKTINTSAYPPRNRSNPSRNSHPRLSLHPSPPKMPTRTNSTHFLSNPNSLQKKKPKTLLKKGLKPKKKMVEKATQQTLTSTGEGRWKEHLKLTFRSNHIHNKEISLHNNSLKCMEDIFEASSRQPGQSFTTLALTFPKDQPKTLLIGEKERVFLLDWMSFVTAELLCRRNTYHMAVTFIDNYLDKKQSMPAKLQALGAGALLLAVKQEERGTETYVFNVLSGNGSGLSREEIINAESNIILGLGFKLNYSTLPFWCDYFSQRWDDFLKKQSATVNNAEEFVQNLLLLRSPEGQSYRYYREIMQMADALIIHSSHRKFNISELSLAIIYLIVRIQSECKQSGDNSKEVFESYRKGFTRKASPIFNDKFNFNSVFNEFVSQTCNFQITEIIPMIKWTAEFLDMGFSYQIDSRVYEQSLNYEQFLRFQNYSEHIRNYYLHSVLGKQ